MKTQNLKFPSLSIRTNHVLSMAGVDTVEKLASLSYMQLLSMKGMGNACITDVMKFLHEYAERKVK